MSHNTGDVSYKSKTMWKLIWDVEELCVRAPQHNLRLLCPLIFILDQKSEDEPEILKKAPYTAALLPVYVL